MWRKLLFFAGLYFLQGAALAYVVNFQKPYLLGRGISKETMGLFTSLLLIPFIIKVVLGAVSDRWPLGKMGSRKPYMLLGLALFGGCYFGLMNTDPAENFVLFATLTWFASLGLAWFDTCADGWAVDVASESEESSIQAAMISGKSLGLITMSLFLGYLGMRYGFQAIFKMLALLSFVVLIGVLFVKYQPKKQPKGIIGGKDDLLKRFFLAFAAFGVVYSVASFGTDGLITLYLTEIKLVGPMDIGFFGMYRGAGALFGALMFALVSPRFGWVRTQYLALAMLALGCILPVLDLPNAILGAAWGFAWGFQETSYVTLAMKLSRGHWAATLFAACMIFSNVGTSLGEALASPLVPVIGYPGVFGLFAAVAMVSASLVPIFQRNIRSP